MSLTTKGLDEVRDNAYGYGIDLTTGVSIEDVVEAARLQVASDELPLPEGWTFTVERMSHDRWMAWAEPMHDRNARICGATGPTMLAAVLALDVALRSRL